MQLRRSAPRARSAVVPTIPACRVEGLESRVLLAVFTVTTTADSGPGSLRQAILDGARPASFLDPAVIRFDIPGGGVHTIRPSSPLPEAIGPVTIDGTTQPGYAGRPLIELDGGDAGAGADGLTLISGEKMVRGLAINRFGGNGIAILGAAGKVEGNYIGTDATGAEAQPNGGAGVFVAASSVTVGGPSAGQRNVISGNSGAGVRVGFGGSYQNPSSVALFGNYIGTDVTGAAALGNREEGVRVEAILTTPGGARSNVTIGAEVAGGGNVISGNGGSGVLMIGPQTFFVVGNLIGTDAAGAHALGNGWSATAAYRDGITATELRGANPAFRIGASTAASRNVISGNAGAGVRVTGPAGSLGLPQPLVQLNGNFVGTDAAGGADLGNGGDGMSLRNVGPGVTNNLVSGNGGDGIRVEEASNSPPVSGNYVGTDATGTRAIGNDGDGMEVVNSYNVRVMPTFTNAPTPPTIDPAGRGRNILSGNGGYGVRLFSDFAPQISGTMLLGNYIGTDVTGNAAVGNRAGGVYVQGRGYFIRAATSGGNVISGNGGDGIRVEGIAAGIGRSVEVKQNLIGTNAAGTAALGNAGHGVAVVDASDVLVGGTDSVGVSQGNTIAHNTGDGVRVAGAASGSNRIQANSVFSNGGLGIDLGGDGVTPNDALDADAGANGLQNFPVIRAAATGATARVGTTVQFTLHSAPNQAYEVDLYSSPTRDPGGNGEGARYLGRTAVTTDAAGDALARVTVGRAEAGSWVTATATLVVGVAGSTSEFSAAMRVTDRFSPAVRGYSSPSSVAAGATAAVRDSRRVLARAEQPGSV